MANEVPELHRAGAEIAAVVVDPPGRNEALRQRWRLPFPVISDPDGHRFLRAIDMWNPGERGGIGWPALAVFEPGGREVFRTRSRDFADRTDDRELLEAVRSLRLPPIDLPPADPMAEPIEDPAAFRVDAFGPFFRGIRSGGSGLAQRLTDETARVEAQAMVAMATRFLDAWRDRRSDGP